MKVGPFRTQIVSTGELGPSGRPGFKVLFIRGLVIVLFSGKASHQHLKQLCVGRINQVADRGDEDDNEDKDEYEIPS